MDGSQIDIDWLAKQFPDLEGIQYLDDGGQKMVFSAIHEVDGDVVIKLYKPNSAGLEYLRREILAVARVRSRRVPAIYGDGSIATPIGNCLWVREQRIHGQSVRNVLSPRPMPPLQMLSMASDLLEALDAAGTCNIVHRDVKPDNIIEDSKKRYWLIDFGIARHLELSSMTPSGAEFGKATAGYAPLEQVFNRKKDIGVKTDIFALGVTLYEALSGFNPFRNGAKDTDEVIARMEDTVCLIIPVSPRYTQSLCDLIAAMTQRELNHRPATISELREWVIDITQEIGK